MIRKQTKDELAKQLSEQAYGHYLDRMERAAQLLNRTDIVMGIMALKQVFEICGCTPKGVSEDGGVLWILSVKILGECKRRKFTKQQLNGLYYVIYSSLDLGLEALPELVTTEARSNC